VTLLPDRPAGIARSRDGSLRPTLSWFGGLVVSGGGYAGPGGRASAARRSSAGSARPAMSGGQTHP